MTFLRRLRHLPALLRAYFTGSSIFVNVRVVVPKGSQATLKVSGPYSVGLHSHFDGTIWMVYK